MGSRRGISPVIATVIIVAVTIAVAIAVAFWMTGIIGLFTGFEQLQITSIYDESDGIYLTVKNTGTQTASITDVYVNGKPCLSLGACQVHDITSGARNPQVLGIDVQSIVLKPGETKELRITSIDADLVGQASPGVSVEVKLLTASGKEYPKLLVLQQYSGGQAVYERGRVTSAESRFVSQKGTWTVTITIKNEGTATITIEEILINDKSIAKYDSTENEWILVMEDDQEVCPALILNGLGEILISPGGQKTVSLSLEDGKICSGLEIKEGVQITITLKSAEQKYSSQIKLSSSP